jgi:hypothetical protein
MGLGSKGIFWREESAEAFDQASDSIHIQRVGSTKGVEDVGTGEAGFGISNIMGKLDVGGGGAVFILARDGSYIHAYLDSMYLNVCHKKKITSCMPTYF